MINYQEIAGNKTNIIFRPETVTDLANLKNWLRQNIGRSHGIDTQSWWIRHKAARVDIGATNPTLPEVVIPVNSRLDITLLNITWM